MLSKWLSSFSPRYPRTLIYMLQASEYDVAEYLAWYGRVTSFKSVEQRHTLVITPKSQALLASLWLILLIVIVVGISLLMTLPAATGYLGLLLLLIAPQLAAYLITIPLIIGKQLIQNRQESIMLDNAADKLANHRAIKIAIAGSFGKTTMREIVKTVLSEGKKVAAPGENHNTPIAISQFIQTLTGDEEVLIFELGEYYPGDIRKLCALTKPDIGIITGVNEAHLQKFKTLEQTQQTIFELADYLGTKPLYINGENAIAKQNAPSTARLYNRNGVSDLKANNLHTDLTGTSFTLDTGTEQVAVKSQLLGLHQVGPLLVAAHIASTIGSTIPQIQAGIAKTQPFKHRLMPKHNPDGTILIDDSYNGNPDGAKAVIEFLGSIKDTKRFYITPGLVEAGSRVEEVHKTIGHQLAEAGIEEVILIKNSVTPYIAKGLAESDYTGNITWFNTTPEALAALPHLTVKGDLVLIQNDWPDQYQ